MSSEYITETIKTNVPTGPNSYFGTFTRGSKPQAPTLTRGVRSTTAYTTLGDFSQFMLAIIDGCGTVSEVGMAALDISTGECRLSQVYNS